MVAIAPGATYKQLPYNFSVEHWDYSLGLVLHVQAGNGELFGWFSNPSASASSHWWVAKDGRLFQYLDPDEHQSWAQANGNSEYHSVETEGYPGESLTAAQVATLGRLYAWGAQRWGWPMQLADSPGAKGLAWHGMGGAGWGGHTGCPGDLRKAQRSQILAAAQGAAASPTKEELMTGQQLVDLLSSVKWGDKSDNMLSRFTTIYSAATAIPGIAADVKAIRAKLGA